MLPSKKFNQFHWNLLCLLDNYSLGGTMTSQINIINNGFDQQRIKILNLFIILVSCPQHVYEIIVDGTHDQVSSGSDNTMPMSHLLCFDQ